MKKYTVDEIVNIYEKSGKIMYDNTISEDYKVYNKEARRLISFFKMLEKDKEFGYQCIDKLFESKNIVVKTIAAAYCLALDYDVEHAVAVLQSIADNPDNGIFGFNAEMTLKEWRKNGYLNIYQKK